MTNAIATTTTGARPTLQRLFVYGSLMFPDVYYRVTRHSRDGKAAILEGYQRLMVHEGDFACFPGIRPSQYHTVQGHVISGITEREFKHLDEYEGTVSLIALQSP